MSTKVKTKNVAEEHFRQGLGRFCWYRLARKSECNPLCTSKLHTPYDGDESFLAGPTERSLKIKKIIEETKAHY